MAGATFGRKGVHAAMPAGRRARFIAPPAPSAEDEMAQRREAFLAAERARNGQRSATERDAAANDPVVAAPIFVRGKSLAIAYALWAVLGGISAHRFYLGFPLAGIAQTALWYISLMFWMAGHEPALFSMSAGLLWILADVVLLPGMRNAANDRLERKAEAKALAESS